MAKMMRQTLLTTLRDNANYLNDYSTGSGANTDIYIELIGIVHFYKMLPPILANNAEKATTTGDLQQAGWEIDRWINNLDLSMAVAQGFSTAGDVATLVIGGSAVINKYGKEKGAKIIGIMIASGIITSPLVDSAIGAASEATGVDRGYFNAGLKILALWGVKKVHNATTKPSTAQGKSKSTTTQSKDGKGNSGNKSPNCFVAGTKVTVYDEKGEYSLRNIEDIKVGERVASNSTNLQDSYTSINEATHKKLILYAECSWEGIDKDEIRIETLQSNEWILNNAIKIGSLIPPPLDLEEMGLPVDLLFEVKEIQPCPKIARGKGRVITTTVNHFNNDIYELEIESNEGSFEKIHTTGSHKFYCKIAQKWITAQDLEIGEEFNSLTRKTLLKSKKKVIGDNLVYNFTVEADHVYYVGKFQVLVHNNCITPASKKYKIISKDNKKEWDKAVYEIATQGKSKSNYRVKDAKTALELLQAARGHMNRYKNYTRDSKTGKRSKDRNYKKGYERHPVNKQELDVGNDLPHIKWFDGKSSGHIFYD